MTKPKWQKPSQRSGETSIPESIKQSSSQKSSLSLGAARRHLKGFSSSIFLPPKLRVQKDCMEFITDLFFSIALAAAIVLTLFQLRTCSAPRPTSTESYSEIARIVSEQFAKQMPELRKNPEFMALVKGGAL